MTSTDVYLQPDAPDPILDEEVVVTAARQHHPAAGRLLNVDESGGEARAYHLEGGVVMKTQRPHRLRPRTSLSKELVILQSLEAQSDVSVPRALGYGHMEGIEYLCMTSMPGQAVEHLELSASQRRHFLQELGATLRQIHESDQTAMVSSGLIPGDDAPADLHTRLAETFERLLAILDKDDAWKASGDLHGLVDTTLERLPGDVSPVVLHSNPGPEHAFADAESLIYTGLIDFGDSYRSHPALDLRPWSVEDGGAELLAGYRQLGPLPSSFVNAWRACLVVMELARATRGYRTPVELAERLTTIAEVPS